MKIGIIGFGRMGSAIARALSKNRANRVLCNDSGAENLVLARKAGLKVAKSNSEVAEKSDFIFLCVKPKAIEAVLAEIKPAVKNQIIVSIAAGKTINSIEKIIGQKKVVRVMPNISALASSSMNVYAAKNMGVKGRKEVDALLSSFGRAVEMDEAHFDAVTGLSGSGPAFTAYFIRALAEAGKANGLGEKGAFDLALGTVLGTAKLMAELRLSPEEVIEMVSSPNGTTVAGRKILESGEFRRIVNETVSAARKRSEEMGKNV